MFDGCKLIASIFLSTNPALGIIWNYNNIKWRIFQGNMIGNNDLFAINIITRKKVQYLSLKKKTLRHVLKENKILTDYSIMDR
jgi:hypothetical protein